MLVSNHFVYHPHKQESTQKRKEHISIAFEMHAAFYANSKLASTLITIVLIMIKWREKERKKNCVKPDAKSM